MKSATGAKTQVELARFLGISPPSIHAALRRGEIPEAWLLKVSEQKRCRVEWLRTGEGPETIDEAVAETRAHYGIHALKDLQPLLEDWKDLDQPSKQALESCLKVLKFPGNAEVIEGVTSALLRNHQHDKKKQGGKR